MAQRGVRGGKLVTINDVYECDEVARVAQLRGVLSTNRGVV